MTFLYVLKPEHGRRPLKIIVTHYILQQNLRQNIFSINVYLEVIKVIQDICNSLFLHLRTAQYTIS